MMIPLLLLALTAVLLVVLARTPVVARWLSQARRSAARRVGRSRPEMVHVLQKKNGDDGEATVEEIEARYQPREQPAAPSDAQPEWRRFVPQPSNRTLLLAALALLVVLSVAVLPRAIFAPREQFLVLIAPFAGPDGTVTESGRSAARQLAEMINKIEPRLLSAQVISTAPNGTEQALNRIRQDGADALLSGTLIEGGMIDQESLMPMLVYQPSGAFAPTGWDGYSGRFAMPRAYALSAQPINGLVVLPELMRALAQYGAGQFDGTVASLETLLNDYPALAQPLPHALLGNISWALGNYGAAVDHYQRTGVLQAPAGQPSELALLANNLGAIQQDAQNQDAADQSFAQAVALLQGQELPQLRLNLARDMLLNQRYNEAIAALEPLRGADMPLPVATALIDAYLGARRFDDAEQLLEQHRRRADDAGQSTVNAYANLLSQRYATTFDEQRIRLTLGRAVGSNDRLLWELMTGQALSRAELDRPHDDLAGLVERTTTIEQNWQNAAAAADVGQRPYEAQIANEQARRIDGALRTRRKLLAAIDLELARERSTATSTVANAFASLRGQAGRFDRIQQEIAELQRLDPDDIEAAVLMGFAQLANDQREPARQAFEQANTLAPTRPEPPYGLAQIALKNPSPEDRAQAKAFLGEAIAREPTFYPARSQLADMAEEDRDWATAIDQRRWLATERGSTQDTLALARTLQNSGPTGYSAAEQALLPLANDGNVDALLQLSNLYIVAGNAPAAHATLDRARASAPKDATIALQLGQVLKQLGRTEEAQTQFEQSVALDGDNAQARVELGQMYAEQSDIERAALQYEAALKSGTQDTAALQEIGRVLLIAGDGPQALDAYQKAIEIKPDDPAPHLGAAHAYLYQNKPQDAVREAMRALELAGGTNPPATVALGDASLQFGDLNGAVGHYTLASQQDPNLAGAKLGLGRAAAASGDWAVAQGYFQQVITLDPQSADAYFWTGETLLQGGNVEGARNAYQTALTLRLNYPEAHYGLAKTHAAAGRLDEAHAEVAQALKLRGTYAEALVLDGLVYERQNQRDQARDSYSRAIRVNNSFAEAYYRRALLFISDGNMNEARRDLEAAVRYRGNFAEAHYWLGRNYLSRGEPQEASEQFELAITNAGGNYPEALFYQAVAHEELGDRANAYTAYQSALEQARGSPWADEAEAALARLGQ